MSAAVWGMCPDAVNALLKQAGGVAPMTWDDCEKHNLKHYKEVFIVPKFDPQTYGEWYHLLLKIEPNLFIREFHLKKADEQWSSKYVLNWEKLKFWIIGCDPSGDIFSKAFRETVRHTDQGYVSYATQIKQTIESAKQPTVQLNF